MPLCANHEGSGTLRLGVCVRNTPEFAVGSKGKVPKKEDGHKITKGASAILFLLPHVDADEVSCVCIL